MPLPEAQGVNVGALSRLFADTTNSYKHLFFDALLSAFRDSGFTCLDFAVRELAVGMVAKAWDPMSRSSITDRKPSSNLSPSSSRPEQVEFDHRIEQVVEVDELSRGPVSDDGSTIDFQGVRVHGDEPKPREVPRAAIT